MIDSAARPTGEARDGPRLTVTLTNYNGRELLEAMLESLAQQTLKAFETVVVDDGSSDDSVEYLRDRWPAVRVLELGGNSGVTAAMNAALSSARTELVALFNNDMELEPACLAELVAALDEHPEAGSATPKMLDFAERDVIDGAGDLLSWRGGGRRRGHGERDRGQFEQALEIFGPCGGAAMYRRRVLDEVGQFDEAYFAYYEDIDWAFRAQLAGHRCRYVPRAVLAHHGSATLGRGITDSNGYLLWRNPIWLVAKCFPAGSLLRHSPELLRGQAGNLFVAARAGKLRVWVRSIGDALRGLPEAFAKRRVIQRSRKVTLSELEVAARVPDSR